METVVQSLSPKWLDVRLQCLARSRDFDPPPKRTKVEPMKKLLDVPATTDVFTKDLQEQRAIYRDLSRQIDDLTDQGVEPPSHLQDVHMALSDHFIALSQGR